MNKGTIKLFILHPMGILKTIYYSIRYKGNIKSTWKGKIKNKGSLSVNGELLLGMSTGRIGEVGQIDKDSPLIQIAKKGTITINGDFIVYPGAQLIVAPKGNITIGKNSFINSFTRIISQERIEIGDNCAISWDVQIMDTDVHNIIINEKKNSETKPVFIGNNVWIGSKVIILKGVTVGDGAVIAAGSIVTKDVPPNTIVAGNPASVVREAISWAL